jgi:hypothetical protein
VVQLPTRTLQERLRALVAAGEIEPSRTGRKGQRGGRSVTYRLAEPALTVPAEWRVATADLLDTMRTHTSKRDALAILDDLERAGIIVAVDATGYAILPAFAAEYGDAIRSFGGPS